MPPSPSPRRPGELAPRDELWVIGTLVLLTLGLLVATLPGIDMGGDAAWKWAFVRSWGRGLPWVYDHHTARFAVNVPIYLTQQLFGTHVNAMYVAPVVFAALQIALVYECGQRLCSRGVGLAAAAMLLAFEPWTAAATRLLPGVFQTTYLLLALISYAAFARSSDRRWLMLLGLSMFLAYEAMITSLYFVPGFVLAVWWIHRRMLDNFWWLIVLGAALALETALYAWLSDFPRGQLQIAGRTHNNVASITFWGLFGRYPALPRVWQIGLAGGAVCAALVPWLTRSRALHGLCMVIATVFVAMTFGIKQLEPLVPALNFRARYFDPLVPLLALAIAACVRAGWRMYLQRKGKPANTMRERAVPRQVLAVACAALVCEVAVLTAIHGGVTGPQQLARNAEQARTLSEAYLAGTAIVANNAREHDQVKTLTVIAFAFLSDEAFWSQASPLKPRVMRVTVGRRSHRLMVRAPRETERLVRDIAKKRCAVFAARVSAKQGLKVQRGETSGCPSAL